jgi:LytS/YehU family sensor histidine kinase
MSLEKIAVEKEKENLKTELAFLRSQISPHFVFNVLNNMVALSRMKSEDLEPSLIKLSSLLRYMLYETKTEKVLLNKEIEYLRSYIDLQSQRFARTTKIVCDISDPDRALFLEPMLLIPFVENAFKHGTGSIENAEISIKLKTINDVLHFEVKNNYNDTANKTKDSTSGIGLQNVKRRLELLYPNNYLLMINREKSCYAVTLQINF